MKDDYYLSLYFSGYPDFITHDDIFSKRGKKGLKIKKTRSVDVSFALGSFRLRLIMDSLQSPSVTAIKEAQTQLLKAAKLNSNKPSPFALLGLWYEEEGDTIRSVGCFTKALLLDPAHPVAGR